jgi:CubicO group peptidase (beta-lactamase class C family)
MRYLKRPLLAIAMVAAVIFAGVSALADGRLDGKWVGTAPEAGDCGVLTVTIVVTNNTIRGGTVSGNHGYTFINPASIAPDGTAQIEYGLYGQAQTGIQFSGDQFTGRFRTVCGLRDTTGKRVQLVPVGAEAAACAPPQEAADDWAVAAPDAVGLDPGRLCALVPWAEGWKEDGTGLSGVASDIHAVLVVRHDKLVFEQYFSGADQHRVKGPLGDIAHSRDQLHDARSVTKSVVALVLGIAIDRGMVKLRDDLDTPVFDLLPQYADLRTPEKARITLRHLLTMSAGLNWDESNYGDPQNSEVQMNNAPDPTRFVLSQTVVAPAGEVFNYSGGSAALIAAILKRATGRPFDVLAHDLLFAPLGIADVEWARYRATGEPAVASGLRLLGRDFAKLGQLVLAHGVWGGKQVVPAQFLAQATAPQINGLELYFYGYQFWLGRSFISGREIDWIAAVGLGGQRIFVVPTLDLVAVVNAGLYSSPLQEGVPLAVLNRYVLAAANLPR